MRKFDRRKPKPEHYVNERIPFPKLFLVDENGEKLGVKTKQEALDISSSKSLDLVIISNNPKQPVAKILDYGKFKYERKKRNKEAKAKQTIINNREVRLTPMIGEHDLKTKAKKAREFITNGDRVKVSLKFRGRELARKDLGYEKLQQFFEILSDIAQMEKEPTLNGGRFLDMYLVKMRPGSKKKVEETKINDSKEVEDAKDENKIITNEEN